MKAIEKRINQLYFPRVSDADWSFDDFVGRCPVRYFSYGRWALYEALQTAGIEKGDKVLLPAFICRDLLSAINTIGAVPVYYRVDKDLQLAKSADVLPRARAILVVNYFGFPQELVSFRNYCSQTGAVLIEDNAHGFLSRDEEGHVLGTRGDIGIFGFRKTVMLPNGAAMVVNAQDKGYTIRPQIEPEEERGNVSGSAKRFLRNKPGLMDLRTIRLLTSVTRTVREMTTGHRIAPSAPDAEFRLPENAAPCPGLRHCLDHLDAEQEISRRRELYQLIDPLMRHAGVEPVFASLRENVVPYAYPFYARGYGIGKAKEVLKKLGLECFPWPELPDAVMPEVPAEYKSVWMIPFLW